MRLIDIETFRHPAECDHRAAGAAEAPTPTATPETPASFALYAVPKLLNPLLQILLAPSAKVLRPPLRAADAH
jgi:hypothetical protein